MSIALLPDIGNLDPKSLCYAIYSQLYHNFFNAQYGIPNFTRTKGWEINFINFTIMGIKHYDKQFKERAVKLSIQRGNIYQVAKELGISDSQLSKWRKDFDQYGSNSFPVAALSA